MRVMNIHELYFLWNMVAPEPIYIFHALACQLWHQAQDHILVTIYLGPYITCLAWGLSLIDCCVGIQHVGGISPLVVHGSNSESLDDEESLS